MTTPCPSGSKRRRAAAAIPDEIVAAVLRRLPTKSLLRFKSASRSWHGLISGPHFVRSHSDHAKARNPNGQLVVQPRSVHHHTESEIALFAFHKAPTASILTLLYREEKPGEPDYKLSRLHHCRGLLLVVQNDRLIVCNPATRRSLTLPATANPNVTVPAGQSDNITACLGFDASRGLHKVARYFYRKYDLDGMEYDIGMEVLTLGGGGGGGCSWRAAANAPPYPILLGHVPVSIGGAIYYLVDSRLLCPSSPEAILCFDPAGEDFRLVPPPSALSGGGAQLSQCGWVNLMELDGALCVSHWKGGDHTIDIWMHNKPSSSGGRRPSVDSWVRRFSVCFPPETRFLMPVAVLDHDKLLLHINSGDSLSDRLDVYNYQRRSFYEIPAFSAESLGSQCGQEHLLSVIPYEESMAPL